METKKNTQNRRPRSLSAKKQKSVTEAKESKQSEKKQPAKGKAGAVKSVRSLAGQEEKKGSEKLKIIPLGGLNEIGKNMTVFEYGDDIFLVDCGLTFPDDERLGVDMVIPDMS